MYYTQPDKDWIAQTEVIQIVTSKITLLYLGKKWTQ